MSKQNLIRRVLMIISAAIVLVILALVVRASYVLISVSNFKRAWEQESRQTEGSNSRIVVALGDSTVQGIGVFRRGDSFVSQVANRLSASTHQPVQVFNFSVTGAESGDVLKNQLSKIKALKRVDAVIVAVGPNDITHKKTLEGFLENYDLILSQLPAEKTVIASLPPMGPRDSEGRTSLDWGESLRRVARKHSVVVAPVFEKVKPHAHDFRIYGGDFYHPSRAGYKLWADAFEESLQKIISG